MDPQKTIHIKQEETDCAPDEQGLVSDGTLAMVHQQATYIKQEKTDCAPDEPGLTSYGPRAMDYQQTTHVKEEETDCAPGEPGLMFPEDPLKPEVPGLPIKPDPEWKFHIATSENDEVPGEERGRRRRSSSPGLLDRVQLFDRVAQEHAEAQATNPFSDHFQGRVSPRPDDPNYGKPKAGSRTEQRGKKAASQVHKEMVELCAVIAENGHPLEDGGAVISFGELFQIYTYISNNVVGLLLGARKQKLVDFEGETLFQRRDDDVPIVLLMPLEQVREHFRQQDAE